MAQLLAERVVIDGVPVWRDYIYGPTGLLAVEAPVASVRPASCLAFTDAALQAQVTAVRAVHVTELRTCVNDLRAQRGLGAAAWTDATITPGVTTAKTAHITELRSALAAVYTAAGATPPGYTDPTLSAGTTPIRAVHIGELRAAATAVPLPPPTIQTFYYHTDQIGSVRAITNAAAQTVARYDFDPFGTELQPAATFRDPRLFAGGERDPETTLDYFGARYYGAHLKRFLNPDDPAFGAPFDPQEHNLYGYARHNPLRFIDPTGHKCENGYDAEKGVFCTETIGEDPYRRAEEAWLMAQQFFLDSLFNYLLTPQVANFSAGVGDALTGRMIPGVNTSLTEYARNRMGTEGVVTKNSLAYRAGDLTGGTVGWALVGSGSATAAAIANGKNGRLFGRGTQTLFNSSKVRFGWGWEGPATTGRDVIRLGIGPARGKNWWSHIKFWYP